MIGELYSMTNESNSLIGYVFRHSNFLLIIIKKNEYRAPDVPLTRKLGELNEPIERLMTKVEEKKKGQQCCVISKHYCYRIS